ncbi:MAG TPA: cyclic nucleotide-binding domain-containing protein [Myxococcales bacterium]|jgi:tetratricopeptide (TPR) repeat protein
MEAQPTSSWRQVRKLEQEGKFAEAAEILERSGELERAINNWKKAGEIEHAAELLKVNGRGAQAAELFESAGQHLKAAAIYEEIFEFAAAAAALVKAGQPERAAAMYEQSDEPGQAGALFASLGNFRKAAQLYERAGDPRKSAEMQARAKQAPAEEEPPLDVVGGMVDVDRVVAAVVAHLRAGRAEAAAAVYGACQERLGYNVLTAVAADPEAERFAAKMFVCANDFPMAAQVFENQGDYRSAAAMFERGDDPYMAAEMFVRLGDVAQAAEMYERSGHFRQAAELYEKGRSLERTAACYEKSDDHFLAGRIWSELKNPQRALQALQKVKRGAPQFYEASRLLGLSLAVAGHLDVAIVRLADALQGAEVSEATAGVFYALARVHEQAGHGAEARDLYLRLAAFKPDFADAAGRAQALRGAAPAPRPAAPAAPASTPRAPAPRAGSALVSMMDGFEFLKGTPLFRDLSLEEMKAVYHACETRRFAPGEVLIEQDQPGAALLVLRKGAARVVRISDEEDVVARLGPGSPVGEMALIDDAPTSARVVAETEVEAFCITRELFAKLLASTPSMAVKLYRFFALTLAKRLRSTSQHLAARTAGS